MKKLLCMAALPLALFGCSSEPSGGGPSTGTPAKTDAEYEKAAVQGMHDLLLGDIQDMIAAAQDLQAAAPTPPDRGWDAKLDADAIAKMRNAWVAARAAYELSEGALAPLFPNLDLAIDARYDDFMTQLQSEGGDKNLFDDKGVTGMHGIERILYADVIPPYVDQFEKTLPGYVPAAFPATADEAASFKNKLCARFITDAQTLEAQWTPANIQVVIAYQGLVSLVREQLEKVQKAASFEEESRYSQRTMADLRNNLAGAKAAYANFKPWIQSKKNASDPSKDGPSIDAAIEKGFADLDAAYQAVQGEGIPTPPDTWSSVNPSAADLMTPFGKLWTSVKAAADSTVDTSIVAHMNKAGELLGFPEL
jgi:iron uptake system component EfeO